MQVLDAQFRAILPRVCLTLPGEDSEIQSVSKTSSRIIRRERRETDAGEVSERHKLSTIFQATLDRETSQVQGEIVDYLEFWQKELQMLIQEFGDVVEEILWNRYEEDWKACLKVRITPLNESLCVKSLTSHVVYLLLQNFFPLTPKF